MEDFDNIKILLMDADKDSCDEIQEFLQKEGFIVFPAHSAASGDQVLAQMQIDILFLDIRLPDADGMGLLKEYKSRYPQLEVIIISGHGDMNSVIQAMRLNVLDFLRKPLRQTDLRSAIERSQKIRVARSGSSQEDKNPLHDFHLAI